MIPVVELLRVSTETQAAEDRAGLAGQRTANARTCASQNLRVVETVEIIESGTDVARSPQMGRVLELVTSGAVRGIVLAEYSRLFRPDRWSDLVVLQTFADCDAQIYLPSGPIDLRSELGFVQATINNLLAAMERRRIRERMDRGKEEHRKRGEHVSGGVGIPFGLAYTAAGGWAYTPEIELMREMFRRFIAGERNIAALGRRLGLPRTNVRFLLTNPVYTGWRVYDERRDMSASGLYPGGDRKTIKRAAQDVVRVRLPLDAIVSDDDFALVQQILAEGKRRRTRIAHSHKFLYRGFLSCDSCGHQMYGVLGNGGRQPYYICRTHYKSRRPKGAEICQIPYAAVARLDSILDGVIADRLLDPALLAAAIDAYNASVNEEWRTVRGDTAGLAEKLTQLRGRRERVIETYLDGAIDRAGRDARLAAVDTEISAIRAIMAGPARPPASVLPRELILGIMTTFAEWRFLQREAKRRVLEALNPTFRVREYDVRGVSLPIQPYTDSRWKTADHVALYLPHNSPVLYVPLIA